ncbi:hypothetical protein B0T16DRAFT_426409 [Cercophora newfieldiana]|uniref:YAG7-like dimerisation domain-containing protein n=1 Tax=Cercophora newfieldiana TaxID=92897 RepID=A0AA39YHK2_9PEZI|nr:hypothetical protein B0T16DRAFT_426409 [Cercophora newfieldiana]
MASSAVQNPPAPTESKSAKKKKAKAERTESPAPAAQTPEKAASIAASANQEDASDNQFIRELQKCTNLVKIESVVAEHKGQSLDDLVSAKVINADQKASLLKKPSLQSQLAQFEEQLSQHKKVEAEHRARVAELQKSLTEKAEKEKAALVAETKAKAEADADAALRSNLLILSQFLRLAAARRAEDIDSTSDENMALEGVLLHIYSGDDNAVSTMLKLVQGADEQTTSTGGDVLETTFAVVKKAAIAHALPLFQDAAPTEVESTEPKEPEADPTVVNAGLTEIEEGSAATLTNGHTEEPATTESAPSNADVTDNAANAAGESQWDTGNVNDLTMSQEWVDVKAEAAEAENAFAAAPVAAPTNSQSWADDHPEAHEVPAAATDSNDGFHQVQRNRGNREGGYRGRGGDRGGYRGRGGHRGDGRGRGRGRGGDRGGMPSRPRRGGAGGAEEQH